MTVLASENPIPRAPGPRGTALLVANFKPDVGFAWWLMERFWVRAAALAKARGFSAIVAFPVDGPLPPALVEAGIASIVHPIQTDGLGSGETTRLLRDLRVKAMYLTDRVHSSPAYARYRLRGGVRTIVTHDHAPGDRPAIGGLRGLLKDLWQASPLVSGDLRICVSPFVLQRARENAHIPASRLAVVQNGIRPEPCTSGDRYVHRELGLAPDKLIAVTVCRADPYKRVDFVIDVAKRYVHERGRRDMIFVHCGDGPDLARLQELVKSAGLEPWFIFAGRRSDVARILCSSNIAIHPSQGEAFSLAILEYMNASLVTFVPDLPSVCQAITHGETGFIYPDGTTTRLLDDLVAACDSTALRSTIGASAHDAVRLHYSMDQMDRSFDQHMSRMFESAVRP